MKKSFGLFPLGKGTGMILLLGALLPFALQGEENLDAFDQEASVPVQENGSSGSDDQSGLISFQDRSGRTYILDMLAAADMVGEWDKEKDTNIVKEGRDIRTYADRKVEEMFAARESATMNRASIRSAELSFYASVDQLAQGTVSIAAHDEGGETFFDVHEVSLYFPVTPIPGLSFKVGRFFMDAGKLNGTHQHDWHFTRPPVVHEKLMADEGVGDFGGEVSYLMPLPFWQELTVGVFNGRYFGHAHEEGPKKQNPLVVVHLKNFVPLGDAGFQFGFTALRWHPDTDPHRITYQSGLDATLKWRDGKKRSITWQTEAWYRETRLEERKITDSLPEPVETKTGIYSFLEWQFMEEWATGFRLDYYNEPGMTAEGGYLEVAGVSLGDVVTTEDPYLQAYADNIYLRQGWVESYTVKNAIYEGALSLTYKPSEFSYFRGTVTERYESLYRDWDTILNLQATFIIGKHPAHVY